MLNINVLNNIIWCGISLLGVKYHDKDINTELNLRDEAIRLLKVLLRMVELHLQISNLPLRFSFYWCDKLIEASDSPPYEIMKIGMSNSEEEDNLFNVDQEESQKLRIQSTRLLIFCYENIIFGQAVFGFGEDYLKLNCLYTRSRVMRKIVC
ncbi:hypothetical protein EKA14_26245 [Bacillus mycoides]|nr:hypothetical protein EKA14_26245 [Bacillus mycoides]